MFCSEGIAVSFMNIGEIGGWEANMCFQDAQRRLANVAASIVEHLFKCVEILADFTSVNDIPAITRETFRNIVRAGERGASIDRDSVVIKNAHQAI